MTQPAKSQEPSMEEILASIRRIIADDDATKSPQQAPDMPKAEPIPPAPPPPSYSAPPGARPDSYFETESPPAAEPSAMAGEPMADHASDILDLTESMATPMPQPSTANSPSSAMPQSASQFRTIDGSSDIGFDEASDRPAMYAAARGDEGRGHLISSQTSAAVDSAFNALAQSVLVQNGRTIEDLVREMLRPMRKSWRDDNLPATVERLVRAEIERVSRGRAS
jgi:uncharacterized protein